MSEEEIIEQFEHWIEYEKQHKDKINKADELIEIQQGLLDLYNKEKEKNKKLVQDNLDLKRLYERTAIKLRENGHIETAEYFEAQIGLCPVWTTWEEYTKWIYKGKIIEKLKDLESKKEHYKDQPLIYQILKKQYEELLEE